MIIFQLLIFYKQLVHKLKVKLGLLSTEQTGPLIYLSRTEEMISEHYEGYGYPIEN